MSSFDAGIFINLKVPKVNIKFHFTLFEIWDCLNEIPLFWYFPSFSSSLHRALVTYCACLFVFDIESFVTNTQQVKFWCLNSKFGILGFLAGFNQKKDKHRTRHHNMWFKPQRTSCTRVLSSDRRIVELGYSGACDVTLLWDTGTVWVKDMTW